MQISTSAFAVVGIAYYVIMGVVIYRSSDRRDSATTRLALVVLVLNEVWNVAVFGGRSTRNGFGGIVLFLIPLLRLQRSLRRDPTSAVVLAPYTTWVLATTCRGPFGSGSFIGPRRDDLRGEQPSDITSLMPGGRPATCRVALLLDPARPARGSFSGLTAD